MSQENPVVVALGTHVEVELIDETDASERLAFDLVPDEQADFANGFLGVDRCGDLFYCCCAQSPDMDNSRKSR